MGSDYESNSERTVNKYSGKSYSDDGGTIKIRGSKSGSLLYDDDVSVVIPEPSRHEKPIHVETPPPVQIETAPESSSSKKITIIALIAAVPLLIVVVVAVVFLIRLDNRNANAINHVEIIRISPNPNSLSGEESITIGLHVSREGLRLGRQEIAFLLRSSNGTIVEEGSTNVFLSSGRASHQTVELFTHYFALGSEYELLVSLNGAPMQLFALFGWL